MKPKTAVIIPNWNGKEFLTDCLNSLTRQTVACRIVVVDNGSTDGSIELIEKDFVNVEILKLDRNHGFAGGVNYGIKHVLNEVDFIGLLNNDAFVESDWLENLVKCLEAKARVGIVTGKILKTDKKHFDSSGEFLKTSGMPYPRGRDELDNGQFDQAEYVFAASGGASLYRSNMLKKIGLFDEDFFAYYEDVDLSFRAQLADWKVWYEPKAVAYHHIGKTSSKLGSFTRYHSVKNFILLYNKNMPGTLFWKYKLRFFWQLTRMKLGSLRDGQLWTFTKAYFKALWLLLSTLRKRAKIQKSRVVSIEYVDALLGKSKAKIQ